MTGSSVPEAARAAAWEVVEQGFSSLDRDLMAEILDAAAPFIVAAAVAEERATTGRRIEAALYDIDGSKGSPYQGDHAGYHSIGWNAAMAHARSVLRAALASPGEES